MSLFSIVAAYLDGKNTFFLQKNKDNYSVTMIIIMLSEELSCISNLHILLFLYLREFIH